MIALWLDWLMVTAGVPWPWMEALPPTTLPPLGPAATGPPMAATKATAAVNFPRMTGIDAIKPLNLQPIRASASMLAWGAFNRAKRICQRSRKKAPLAAQD